MIDVDCVLRDLPHFETFCSLEQLHTLAESLRDDDRFDVRVAGTSVGGVPIYDVGFGKGAVKALVVAGPQAQEVIGSLTVFSLMSLLRNGHPALAEADVEWHIVPCIDPDAALLNEEWYLQPFSFESFVRGFYMPTRPDQVDFSFPIRHKQLVFDRPSHEARVLKEILDRVRPDFYFTLHNYAALGGAWIVLSRDIGEPYYAEMAELLRGNGFALQQHSDGWLETYGIRRLAEGTTTLPFVKAMYDSLEALGVEIPRELLDGKAGATSMEYLEEIKPGALTFVAELTYGRHPGDDSLKETEHELRRLNLRLDADAKFIAATVLEEWDRTHDDLDQASPFYRKLSAELVENRETLHLGVTEWYGRSIHDLLFNPDFARLATERDVVVSVGMMHLLFLANAYTFVRLLKSSKQTPAVQKAIERLDRIFAGALADLRSYIAFGEFEVNECDALARGQLGCGLIALNAVLAEARP
jgi:hypothetical protein